MFPYNAALAAKHRIRRAYRIELRERDHLPPHVHVTGKGANARISLETLAVSGDAPRDVLGEAVEWVRLHREELMKE